MPMKKRNPQQVQKMYFTWKSIDEHKLWTYVFKVQGYIPITCCFHNMRWLTGRIKGSIPYVSTGLWYFTAARHILQHESDKYCPNSFVNHCNTPALLNKNKPLNLRRIISSFALEKLSLVLRRILFVYSVNSLLFLWGSCPPDPGGSNT